MPDANTIFLPAAQHFRVDRQLLTKGTMRCMVPFVYHIFPTRRRFRPALPSFEMLKFQGVFAVQAVLNVACDF